MHSDHPEFVPGLQLAEAFYRQAVEPVLQRHAPDLAYSAGLIGPGSEVLGFDDRMSTDHHWGPRAMLFLEESVPADRRRELHDILADELPASFMGYPTNWSEPNPEDKGVQHLGEIGERPVNHRIEMITLAGFLQGYMGIDICNPLTPADWLTLPWQKLRSVTGGGLFRDDLGIQSVLDRFRWYPQDLWFYVLASCWARIGQEEHLTGRAGWAGDETGSAIIASRLVRDIMRLAFLMERAYPPYPKWFGTAFANLDCAAALQPLLDQILTSHSWQERDAGLAAAYRRLAEMHNALGVTPPVSCTPASFFGRPFMVIYGETVANALCDEIRDPEVQRLARRRLIGSIDLISDNTDFLEDVSRRSELLTFYRETPETVS